jgi:hypothetical protein
MSSQSGVAGSNDGAGIASGAGRDRLLLPMSPDRSTVKPTPIEAIVRRGAWPHCSEVAAHGETKIGRQRLTVAIGIITAVCSVQRTQATKPR